MYSFYVSNYKGQMSEAEFDRVEVRAKAFVKRIQLGRLGESTDEKFAVCAVADVFNNCENRLNSAGVVAENNDGYSVTYADGNAQDEVNKMALSAAKLYLRTYRGVGCI